MTAYSEKTRDAVLVALKEKPGQTAKEIGISAAVANALVRDRFLKVTATRKHTNENGDPQRGRPSNLYANAKRGSDRVRRIKVAA